MPHLLQTCEEQFGTRDLYKILGLKKEASQLEIKKGYHKVSLKVHPDRVNEDVKKEATSKFQTLGKIYCLLSEKEKRAVYDETGDVDDNDIVPQDRDWAAYWRLLFRKINTQDILDFEKNYKESKEELEDLKTAYLEFEGDVEQILNHVMCSEIDDEPRFTKIIKNWIKKKEVPDFPKFSKETAKSKQSRKRKAEAEAAEAEELQQELGITSENSLRSMIQSRQQHRESEMASFFDNLEAKYAQPKKTKKNCKGKAKN